MVFARTTDDALASLVKQIDNVVAEGAEQKLAAFVNVLGIDEETATEAAVALAAEDDFANVAICVSSDLPNGPEKFQLALDADVTVVTYVKKKITGMQEVSAGELDKETIDKIVSLVETLQDDESEAE